MCSCMIETSSVLPRKYSEILGKLCPETTVWPSNNFRRISKILRKVFGNLRKTVKKSSLVRLFNKQNNTWLLVDIEFLVSRSYLRAPMYYPLCMYISFAMNIGEF